MTEQIVKRPLALVAVSLGMPALWWAFEVAQQYLGPESSVAGPVTRVRDGDTIEVAHRPVRLKGITCDEKGTARGAKAIEEVRRLVAQQTVICLLTGETSHDRAVGWCTLPGGRDLGEQLIASRLCGRCARYDPLRKYAAAQRKAGAYDGASPAYCRAPW